MIDIKYEIKRIFWKLFSFDKRMYIMSKFSKKYKPIIQSSLYDYNNSYKKLKRNNKNGKICIVFLCQVPAMWNGLESVYRVAVNNGKVQSFLFAVPDWVEINNNNDEIVSNKNSSYEFLISKGYQVINAFSNKTWFDLKELQPDYVFLQRPYDDSLPFCYKSKVLKDYTKVCYIPYAYDICIWGPNLTYEYNFLLNTYAVFCENNYIYRIIFNIFKTWDCCDSKKVYDLGFPRFDLYNSIKKIDNGYKKTVLWMPRWTTEKTTEATSFFENYKSIIEFFKNNNDIKLILRPHPWMFKNFVEKGFLTNNEVNEIIDTFNNCSNFEYDSYGDYINSFIQSDVIISDFTSLLSEALLLDVPILYCGSTRNFNKYFKKISNSLIKIKNSDQLISLLSGFVENNDDYLNDKVQLNKCKDIGKSIIDALVEDAY